MRYWEDDFEPLVSSNSNFSIVEQNGSKKRVPRCHFSNVWEKSNMGRTPPESSSSLISSNFKIGLLCIMIVWTLLFRKIGQVRKTVIIQ